MPQWVNWIEEEQNKTEMKTAVTTVEHNTPFYDERKNQREEIVPHDRFGIINYHNQPLRTSKDSPT